MASPLEPVPDHLPEGDVLADTLGVPVEGLPGRTSLVLGHQWRVMYVFGGITMATALRAIEAELDRPDLRLVTADATFCAAVSAGPVAVQVEVLRQGRGGAQAQARLWRLSDDGGGPGRDDSPGGARGPVGADLVVTAVYGRDRDLDVVVRGMSLPEDAGSPDSVPRRLPDPARPSPFDHIPYHRQTDFRMTVGQPPWEMDEGPREPRTVSWFRFLRPPILDDGTWDRACLAVPGDILGTAVTQGIGRREGFHLIITLQLSMQFFAPMTGEWVCQQTRCTEASHGFAAGTAELFRQDGALVAMATQSALLQPFTNP